MRILPYAVALGILAPACARQYRLETVQKPEHCLECAIISRDRSPWVFVQAKSTTMPGEFAYAQYNLKTGQTRNMQYPGMEDRMHALAAEMLGICTDRLKR